MRTHHYLLTLCSSLIFGFMPMHAMATEWFACTRGTEKIFSQSACPAGYQQSTQKNEAPSVSKEETARAAHSLAQDKKEAERLRARREKNEAAHERATRAYLAREESKKKRCDLASLRTRWAEEDFKNASPKAQKKAESRWRRAQERAHLACPSQQ